MLEIKNLAVEYNGKKILNNINFNLYDNQWLMVVGPNGAGKSTLLKAISKDLKYEGQIYLNGIDISAIKQNLLAREIGVLMQNHNVNYSYTVMDIVSLGRYSYGKKFFSQENNSDKDKIDYALECTGLSHLKDRSVLTLSGGELQRTFLAQVLAQDPKILLLDEPSNHLDLIYQKQVFQLISEWVKIKGKSVVSVVHDLSIAKAYGTGALLLNKGNIVSFDKIDKSLSSDNLNKVYKIDVPKWMIKMLSQWQME